MNTKSKKSNNFGGWGLYLVFVLAFIVLWWNAGNNTQQTNITKIEFAAMLQAGQVEAVQISQNAEVPTGNVTVLLKDETKKSHSIKRTG